MKKMMTHYIRSTTVCLAGLLVGCAHPSITVTKRSDINLCQYKHAYVYVCDADWAPYMHTEILNTLAGVGLPYTFQEGEADVRVECCLDEGWCRPYIGRHFELYFSAMHTTRISVLDPAGSNLLYQAEYDGHRSGLPPNGLVDAMFSAMLGKDIHNNLSGATPEQTKAIPVTYITNNMALRRVRK